MQGIWRRAGNLHACLLRLSLYTLLACTDRYALGGFDLHSIPFPGRANMAVPALRVLRVFALSLLVCCVPTFAQYAKPVCSNGANTTTISGVVYSPNGQDPLPDVLVYVPGAAGAAVIPDGVTKVDLRPTSPLTQTTTAYDGSFTLTDAPAGTSVPLVIQSGKWQRKLVIATVTGCQDNVPPDPSGDKFARFPRNKSEGYIPRIAVVTGSVESTECILRKVGMDDAEFTNFSTGGRINLYLGSRSGGSRIDGSTPGEAALMADTAQLNSLDLILFPCQGGDQGVTATGQSNLVSFANNGGRIFVNHHSHAWLKNNTGFDGAFNWGSDGGSAPSGPATVDQTFTIGATMALWLQNLGQTTTQGLVSVTNVFSSLASLTANAQRWISLNSNGLPIQASFDTPVGAGQGNTYGRVLYNEYHVSPASSSGTVFPNECSSSTMSQQEKMLEFSLFDLSSFAAISKVVPDMTLTGSPDPSKFGATVTMTATLSVPSGSTYSTPTGAVTFSEGSTTLGTAVAHAGKATQTLTGLSAGTHTITASYAGDPYYTARTITTTITVYPPATVTVVANPNPVYTAHASVITVTVAGSATSPAPTGTAAVTVDGVTTTYPLVNGVATVPGKVYANGQHIITAVYSGDANYDSKSGTTTLYVQVPSSTALSEAAPNVFLMNPAVFTATAVGVQDAMPTGTMTFFEGSTVLGSVVLTNGVASLSLSNLTFGQHTVTASYSGDNYYGPSASTAVVENVMDYQLTVTQASDTIPHSTAATYTFTVTPLGGTTMPAEIKVSLDGLRNYSTYTMSPATIAAGTGATTVTLTIQTSTAPSIPPYWIKSSLGLGSGGAVLALLLLPIGRKQRRRTRQAALLLVLMGVLCGAATGCGTGWKTLTYRVDLLTNSGALSHNASLTLTEEGGK